MSRKSSRSNMSGSDPTRPEHGLKRSLSGDEMLSLHDMPGTTASAVHVHDSKVVNSTAI